MTLDNAPGDVIDAEVIAPSPPRKAVASASKIKGIAILGSNPVTVMEAPLHDPSWLIYSCSPHNIEHRTLPRVDQWFEVHDPIEDPTRAFAYLMAVSKMPFAWLRDQRALASGAFAGGKAYPERLVFGTKQERTAQIITTAGQVVRKRATVPNCDGLFCPWMFTSSIAFMLAKAIIDCEQQDIKEIGMWGIMQASNEEYAYQRPGIQYFIWEAMRRGIRVTTNQESALFDLAEHKW